MDGLVLHVRQIDRGHLPVPVSDWEGNVDMLKRRHLSAHKPRAEADMPVHSGTGLDPLDQDSEDYGIKADFPGRSPVTMIAAQHIHQKAYVRVVDKADMRDGFPTLRGHIGDDLSGNIKIFCHGFLPCFA